MPLIDSMPNKKQKTLISEKSYEFLPHGQKGYKGSKGNKGRFILITAPDEGQQV